MLILNHQNATELSYSLVNHGLPGPSHSFVVVLGVNSQDADTRPDVDQQQGIGVLQCVRPLDAAIRVRGVFKVVALRGADGHHGVNVQNPSDQTLQLV